jgi:hypothetical protein
MVIEADAVFMMYGLLTMIVVIAKNSQIAMFREQMMKCAGHLLNSICY